MFTAGATKWSSWERCYKMTLKMLFAPYGSLEIRPVSCDELEAILQVYKQCEDFLALGPVPTASMEMVMQDIEMSRQEGGTFCGIHIASGEMIGVVDYVPAGYQGDPHTACLELLMIAAPYRKGGVGRAAVKMVEAEIRNNVQVSIILAGVQVNNPLAVKFWQRQGYRIVSGPALMPDQTTVYGLRKDLRE
jgi:ribosomal protein S18 acetylase RimI-like enzyme